MTAALSPVAPSTAAPASRGFRPDIQGLRAVAVLLVLGYHAGVPFLGGGYVGVDVFFVISGFLITGLVLREVERTGRLSLRHFYARRAKRLLPATAVVFAAVAVLTVLVLPVTRWRDVAGDLAASAVYLVNWRLADRSVDYLAAGSAASPLQHFWSLAVEEQFYVVWPLLVVALLWWRGGGDRTRRLLWGLLALAVPSFLWAVHQTAAEPGAAYFVTTTRLWEMAVGALLAVGVARAARVPVAVRRVLGWAGLAAIAVAAVTYDAATAFPGAAALVPTLGAAAVLLAGCGDGRGEVRALTGRPMQTVGALSYSLYLWHWPLLVVATAAWAGGESHLPLPTALAVVTASALPAWLTYRAVEQPFHRSARLRVPWRAGVLAAVCVAVGLGSAGLVQLQAARSLEQPADTAPGAAVLGADPAATEQPTRVDTVTPPLVEAPDDVADVYADGCHQVRDSAEVASCVYGEEDSDTVVALVGDSHAAHWQPALEVLAEENGWRLETYTKSSCLFGDALVWNAVDAGPYESCHAWQEELTERLAAQRPDAVVVSADGSYRLAGEDGPLGREESVPAVASAMAENWQRLEGAGVDVLALMDTPSPGLDVPECVATHLPDLEECAVPREEAVDRSGQAQLSAAAEQTPGVDVVDLTEYVCPQEECLPVVGGVLTHSDSHHLTATYARSLAPRLEEELADVGAFSSR